MIVVDIETSGKDSERHGIWQIGALDLDNSENIFLEEARIDDEDEISEEALIVIGKTEEELRDEKKQSQKNLIEHFFNWCGSVKIKNLLGHNPKFDAGFLEIKARKYELKVPFGHRAFDLHTAAQIIYYMKIGKFLFKEGKSDMSLSNTLKFCGLPDERIILKEGKVVKQGKPHNALEDAKLEAECFSRLVYGKSLFPEYAKFKIPEELEQ